MAKKGGTVAKLLLLHSVFWHDCRTGSSFCNKQIHLVLVNFPILKFSLSLLLKSNDDEGNKNVDKEEGEDDEKHNVKYRHFYSKQWNWTFVFVSGSHRMLKYPKRNQCTKKSIKHNCYSK